MSRSGSPLGAVSYRLTDASRPLLVLGPSLGTGVTALWHDVVRRLPQEVDVIGWDLPGHATAPEPAPHENAGLTITGLAEAVLEVVARAQGERGDADAPFWYAGVSVGGAVGLRLVIDAPQRLHGAALLNTAAHFGPSPMWLERADLVARAGTPTQVLRSTQRWFGPGFVERNPQAVLRLLAVLQLVDRGAYAAVCRAVAGFDLRDRLVPSELPLVMVAGECDLPTPPSALEQLARGLGAPPPHVLAGVAHLAPVEQPDQVADLLRGLLRTGGGAPGGVQSARAVSDDGRAAVTGR